jgi:hypothetical protein
MGICKTARCEPVEPGEGTEQYYENNHPAQRYSDKNGLGLVVYFTIVYQLYGSTRYEGDNNVPVI